MNLETLTSLIANLAPLKVRSHLCSRQITPKSSCNKCFEICPTQGISLSDDGLHVDECCYCGKCVSICPNHVFKLEEDLLLDRSTLEDNLIITCSPVMNNLKIKNKEKITKINCLSQIYPELLFKLITTGKKDIIFFVDSAHCDECLKFDITSINASLSMFNQMLSEKDLKKIHFLSNPEELTKFIDSTNHNHGRRQFFSSIFSSTKKVPRQILSNALDSLDLDDTSKQKKTGTNTSVKPMKKILLYEALKEKELKKPVNKLHYNNLEVQKCIYCEACSKLCPTNALKIKKENNEKYISFTPHLCTECNICIDICLLKGINWKDKITVQDFLNPNSKILASSSAMTCSKCKNEFWDTDNNHDNICPWCR